VNSVRRPASASRTFGRYAGALRALLDSAAYLDAPTNRRRTNEEKISYRKRRLTGPAPSGMTGPSGRMRFGLGTYFDKLDVSEAVAHEIAHADELNLAKLRHGPRCRCGA
jgi:hypothetical protein